MTDKILEGSTTEQKEFITSELQNCKLIGCSQSGMTRSITRKILYHIENKDINDGDYLVLVQSVRGRSDFLNKGNQGSTDIFTLTNIATITNIATWISKEFYNKTGDRNLPAIDLLMICEESGFRKVKCLSTLKVIFVDDAHDITPMEYDFISLLAEKLKVKLILVGDPNQNIYQFQNDILSNYEAKEYKLTQSYCLIRKTMDAANGKLAKVI
jgi:superfamily I DNA/RNA helicase